MPPGFVWRLRWSAPELTSQPDNFGCQLPVVRRWTRLTVRSPGLPDLEVDPSSKGRNAIRPGARSRYHNGS
jgi:hypothetical protein